MSDALKPQVRALVVQHVKLGDNAATPEDSTDLFAAGMTSLNSVNLMLALEDAFDVEFPNELLKRETFESIDAIAEALATLGAVPA